MFSPDLLIYKLQYENELLKSASLDALSRRLILRDHLGRKGLCYMYACMPACIYK